MGTLKEVLNDGKLIALIVLLVLVVAYLLFGHQKKDAQVTTPPKMPMASMTPIIHGPSPNSMTPLATIVSPGTAPMAMGQTLSVNPAGQPLSTNPAGYVLGAPTAAPMTQAPASSTPAGQ